MANSFFTCAVPNLSWGLALGLIVAYITSRNRFQYFSKHPWRIFWIAYPLFGLILFSTISYISDHKYMPIWSPVSWPLFLSMGFLGLAFVQGIRVSWLKSWWRGARILLALLLFTLIDTFGIYHAPDDFYSHLYFAITFSSSLGLAVYIGHKGSLYLSSRQRPTDSEDYIATTYNTSQRELITKYVFSILTVILFILAYFLTSHVIHEGQAVDSIESGDYKTALKLLIPMADVGEPVAQYELGLMYELGLGLEKNIPEAMNWFRSSADHEYTPAIYNIGLMYINGIGIEQNYAEAMKYLHKAAEKGFEPAQNKLGLMSLQGLGVEKNYTDVMKWFRMAAEKGFAPAQSNLGHMYQEGLGGEQNLFEAAQWFFKAAEQGDSSAQYAIGNMYENGQGIEMNYSIALRCYLKAADQGHAAAQNHLGNLYYKKLGIESDIIRAYAWYSLAIVSGAPEESRFIRNEIESKLTPNQLIFAYNLVQIFWKMK